MLRFFTVFFFIK